MKKNKENRFSQERIEIFVSLLSLLSKLMIQ